MKNTLQTAVIQPLPGIGDMIWYLPALKAIAAAAPDGRITLFTRPSAQAKALLAAEPMVKNIVPLIVTRGLWGAVPNFFRTWKALLRTRPDRLYILHHSARYRWAARLALIPEIIAYPSAVGRAPEDGWHKSLSFLKRQGIPVAESQSRLTVAPDSIAFARAHFSEHPQPWFIIAPAASTRERLWPPERFAFCANSLAREKGGTVFLIGGTKDGPLIDTILDLCSETKNIVPVIGWRFDHIMGLIACSTGLFGNDSGPANVAAALGIPAFPLCGTSTPPPHSPHLHVILPDAEAETGTGMDSISAAHALEVIGGIYD